jgi:hypothetical protein
MERYQVQVIARRYVGYSVRRMCFLTMLPRYISKAILERYVNERVDQFGEAWTYQVRSEPIVQAVQHVLTEHRQQETTESPLLRCEN